ncbi:MAG TPA: hypothetical protein VNN13_04565 [Methylomirabilota bacterium]|nr:hypothetical protein [Methylomirabilota bacterium]
MTCIQAWRFAGVGFLALYAQGILSGLFAWPAGLGDIAVALAAPWVALRITDNPAFASSRAYIVWNLFGVLDLLVAVGTGGLSASLPSPSRRLQWRACRSC